MKIKIASAVFAFSALLPTHWAQAASIPQELLGRYIAPSGSCAESQKAFKETGMWDGVIIDKDRISFIESSCDVSRLSKSGTSSYALILKCSGEGEEWNDKATYKIAGSTLTITSKDGSENFKRCGR